MLSMGTLSPAFPSVRDDDAEPAAGGARSVRVRAARLTAADTRLPACAYTGPGAGIPAATTARRAGRPRPPGNSPDYPSSSGPRSARATAPPPIPVGCPRFGKRPRTGLAFGVFLLWRRRELRK